MPVPPTSTEHGGQAKGEHPGDHDPDYKPKAGASQGKSECLLVLEMPFFLVVSLS